MTTTSATTPTVPKLCHISRSTQRGVTNLKPRKKSMDFIRTMTGCFMMEVSDKSQKVVEIVKVNGAHKLPDHLVVMVNGIIGSASDWRYAAKEFVKSHPDNVIVHCSECNSSMLTFDGVDMMGERLAEEVVDVIKQTPGVKKISFVAHSLGGLVARYAIGRLYACDVLSCSTPAVENTSVEYQMSYEARIAGLEPMNFVTFATPHLGSRGHKQLPLLCGFPLLEKGATQTAHWIAGRSGKHLFLTDNDDGQRPLLIRMVNDDDNIKFMSALGSFKRRVAYANVNYDYVVGWGTSSIRHHLELQMLNHVEENQKYPHIVHAERGSTEIMKAGSSSSLGRMMTDMEEEMFRGLSQVPWERVDVSFRKSSQRFVAHNTIQVQNYWMNSDGADVVLHMIDHFRL
ncbi:hypothetical protein Leryth_001207 [Lithospermum erythrorhizon]|nr:hypothetical protein Leryth_001207 [Lithospermum erythrorhizon]